MSNDTVMIRLQKDTYGRGFNLESDILAEIFHSVPLEYSTLKVYRSALSAYHPPIQGFKVGQHPLIKYVLRGAFSTRPLQPKYADTWEVNSALQAIIDMGENEDLPFNQLSHKLAMLMSLVSASICQKTQQTSPKNHFHGLHR